MKKAFTLLLLCAALTATAQSGSKMSAFVKRYAARQQQALTRAQQTGDQAEATSIAAFVKTAPGAGEQLLAKYGCRVLTSSGDIYIAVIPARQLQALAADEAIIRIEANEPTKPAMDTTHIVISADKVQPEQYQKWGFQQAFTGKGVVVGITDGGFDFTHPMFRDAQGQTRVKEAWDMLAGKNSGYAGLGSTYKQDQILTQQTLSTNSGSHGSHVMGIAAGSQWQEYRGIAYESDIVVANKLSGGSPEQLEALEAELKTSTNPEMVATKNAVAQLSDVLDYLTVKYVIDYAKAHNQPCVINCSWTGKESFSEKLTLSEEFVNSLAGPGRIIVAGVGNDGDTQTYFEKEASERIFKRELEFRDTTAFIDLSAQGAYTLKMVVGALPNDTLAFTSEEIAKNCTADQGYQATLPILLTNGTFTSARYEMTTDGGNIQIGWIYDKALVGSASFCVGRR